MNIIYLHQYFSTPAMSSGARSFELARRLVRKGHKVYVLSSNHARSRKKHSRFSIIDGIHIWWLPVKYSNNMSYPRRVAAFFVYCCLAFIQGRRLPYDLVFATSTPLTVAIPGILLAKLKNSPFVLEIRDLWPAIPVALNVLQNPLIIKMARLLEKYAYFSAKKIIALSTGMKSGILASGADGLKVSVIPNGSDLDLFNVHSKLGEDFRNHFTWMSPHNPLVVYTGAIGLVNGLSYMVYMARTMLKLNPKVQFCLVGDGREKELINDLAIKSNVLNKNFFMLPLMNKQNLAKLLSVSDITTSFVINKKILWYNSANKFFDGLAAGKPILINYGGWQAKLLEQYKAGIVVPPDDPDVAAEQLNNFLNDKDRLQCAGAAALRLAETKFNCDNLYQSFEQVLRGAANS